MSKKARKTTHDLLLGITKALPTDFEPWGERERDGADCSCGCEFFMELPGKFGADWGVCVNKKSPRAGLLTFEHQGCPEFSGTDDDGNGDGNLSCAERMERADGPPYYAYMPLAEMIEAMRAKESRRALMAVHAAVFDGNMYLWTLDGKHHVIALSSIRPAAAASPDFSQIRVVDHGQTIRLGKYEAAVDALLEDSTEVK
jgi:hypothetical protein